MVRDIATSAENLPKTKFANPWVPKERDCFGSTKKIREKIRVAGLEPGTPGVEWRQSPWPKRQFADEKWRSGFADQLHTGLWAHVEIIIEILFKYLTTWTGPKQICFFTANKWMTTQATQICLIPSDSPHFSVQQLETSPLAALIGVPDHF